MANIKLNDFPFFIRNKLNKALRSITSTTQMTALGNEIKDEIFKRTKLGYGVDSPGGSQKKLKPLSTGYRKQRQRTGVHSSTSPAKSNLTKTGEMLSDMHVRSTAKKTFITFRSALSKNKVLWNIDNGRTFFNISKTQIKAITSRIQQKLLEILR